MQQPGAALPIENIDWPVNPVSGEIYDDSWLIDRRGTRLSARELQNISAGRPPVKGGPGYKAYMWQLPRFESMQLDRERKNPQHFQHIGNDIGQVRGRHSLLWIEHIKQFKREKKYNQALELLQECITAGERENEYEVVEAIKKFGPSVSRSTSAGPWWYEQTDIVLRKMKRYDDSVKFLQTVLKKYPNLVLLEQRLIVACELAKKSME